SSRLSSPRLGEPNRSKSPVARFALIVVAIAVVGSPACGGRSLSGASAPDAGEFPEVCERYLDVYGACMRRLLPQNAEIADARTANARASLERVGDHQQLRDVCVKGATQLGASCQ